eukprot:TRINITY_DN5614_c0_g1_i5.p1 TRINITY_DN5614_c0_g1~~TRINITY_DN5614_c0_g1_i5.p1  ORF type:complete len:587 (-),score=162.78 TRINITY_DN5614_c0_g1_i5:378-2072(-)
MANSEVAAAETLKRKSEEPESEKEKTEMKCSDKPKEASEGEAEKKVEAKESDMKKDEKTASEPEAKRLKVSPVDAAVVETKESDMKKDEKTASEPEAKRLKVSPVDAAVVETKESNMKRDEKTASEPDAKRLKVSPVDAAAVRKQVEYYLSDENLRYDKFFHEKITSESGGWLDMGLIVSCNKMKAMRASKEDVLTALQSSKIEVNEGGTAIRRPNNAPLPALDAKPAHPKKNALHEHDGGVLAVIKSIPAEQSWMQIKEALTKAMPEKTSLWFVGEVSDKNQCFLAAAPFEGDVDFFNKLSIEVGGTQLKTEVCRAEILQQAIKLLPKSVREKREKELRKRQKDRNKPIVVGSLKFVNIGALRGRVKEILNSRSDGEHLKPDGSDFKLIKALLAYHPKGEQKSKGMVGIKVAPSTLGENRCFFMVKEDKSCEDFSAKKCLDALEINPPYATSEPARDKDKEKKNAAGSTEAKQNKQEDSRKADSSTGSAAKEDSKEEKNETTKEDDRKEEKEETTKVDDSKEQKEETTKEKDSKEEKKEAATEEDSKEEKTETAKEEESKEEK